MSAFLLDALTKIRPGRLMFAVLVLPVFFYIYHELSRDVIIIDPFTVPKQFEEAGLSSEVMMNRIGEKLRQIERVTYVQIQDNLMSAQHDMSTPDMEIPGTKLGLKTVVEMTRNVFGIHPKHIGGDIVFPVPALTNDESPSVKNEVTVSVYVTREPSQISATSFTVQGSDLSVLVQRTAEVILGQVNPYILARYLTNRNEYEKAVEVIEGIILKSSEDRSKGKAFSLWGDALQFQKNYDEAIVKYQRAIEIDPKNAMTYNSWGEALREQKKYDEAIVKYQKAIEINPKYAMAYNNWGEALREQKKYDEAIVKYQKAIEIDPKYDEYEEAILKYQKDVDFDRKNAWAMAYSNWGEALREQKKYDEAIVKYQKAIDLDRKNAGAYYGLARVFSALGKSDEARKKMTKYDELSRSQ